MLTCEQLIQTRKEDHFIRGILKEIESNLLTKEIIDGEIKIEKTIPMWSRGTIRSHLINLGYHRVRIKESTEVDFHKKEYCTLIITISAPY